MHGAVAPPERALPTIGDGERGTTAMDRQQAEQATTEPIVLLVVEDEAMLRTVVADFLRAGGFSVLEASSADEAVGMLHRHADIRLVVADVIMPGALNGFDLAEWVAHHRAGIPVMLTSGYSTDRNLPPRLNWTGRLIRKPFRLVDLADRIHALLSQPAA
ncbi:hypothetical protein GCM10011611_34610 [Aliidongia dinghuensis]|uniref:Response regulatory domain-containing protein n=2 Tax=Aliidongia dinghuensis TaxID=1867774 RepID=A0A8J3E4B0_9PROT|nr:hypothetical protein GCM10011611_34610 [Aliidongia dinghuensis]